MSDERRTEGVPHNRLTRMCNAAIEAYEAHPEHRDGDKCIVFLDDGHRGGLVMHGYDDDADAIADLLVHLRAIFRTNGGDLLVMPLGGDG